MSIKITLPKTNSKAWWDNLSKGSFVRAYGINRQVIVYKTYHSEDYLAFYEHGTGPYLVKFPWDAYDNPIQLPPGTKIDLQINVT